MAECGQIEREEPENIPKLQQQQQRRLCYYASLTLFSSAVDVNANGPSRTKAFTNNNNNNQIEAKNPL